MGMIGVRRGTLPVDRAQRAGKDKRDAQVMVEGDNLLLELIRKSGVDVLPFDNYGVAEVNGRESRLVDVIRSSQYSREFDFPETLSADPVVSGISKDQLQSLLEKLHETLEEVLRRRGIDVPLQDGARSD